MKNEQTDSKILKSYYVPTTEFYSQIIDSLQDYSIFTLDKELTINSWSSGSAKIFGYETEEVIGKHFNIIFTEEDLHNEIPKVEISRALKEGRAVDNRWHVCKDGSKFFAYGLVFPLTAKNGELIGFVKILQDLTEKRKSEEAIKKYVQDMEELSTHKENILSILSHDLRGPLGGIVRTAEYLRSDFHKMEPGEIKETLDLIYETSKEELNMLDYLVEWARIKYASQIFSPAKIELVPYVNKVFGTFKEDAAIKNIILHNEMRENTTVFADEKMLISILQNIISNAIKNSDKGGSITVTEESKDNKVIIQIKDTGIGISKNLQKKLFIPQLNLSKARKSEKGAGIGLLLVKGFVENNGGEIWVESVEGEGSSFYFTLPLNKPAEETDSTVNAGLNEMHQKPKKDSITEEHFRK
ncbi:MAG: PAS domain-containing sensor histidine kinase [Ignavibacteriaceae bacterium]